MTEERIGERIDGTVGSVIDYLMQDENRMVLFEREGRSGTYCLQWEDNDGLLHHWVTENNLDHRFRPVPGDEWWSTGHKELAHGSNFRIYRTFPNAPVGCKWEERGMALCLVDAQSKIHEPIANKAERDILAARLEEFDTRPGNARVESEDEPA